MRIIQPTHPPYPPCSRRNCPLEAPASLFVAAETAQVVGAEWTPNWSLLQLWGVDARCSDSSFKAEGGNTSKEIVQQIREITKANRKLF